MFAPHLRGSVFRLGPKDWVWRVVSDRGRIVAQGEEGAQDMALQVCVEAVGAARMYWLFARRTPRELK